MLTFFSLNHRLYTIRLEACETEQCAFPAREVTDDFTVGVHEHGRSKPAKTIPGEEEEPVDGEKTTHGMKYIDV